MNAESPPTRLPCAIAGRKPPAVPSGLPNYASASNHGLRGYCIALHIGLKLPSSFQPLVTCDSLFDKLGKPGNLNGVALDLPCLLKFAAKFAFNQPAHETMFDRPIRLLLCVIAFPVLTGCSEGPLWHTGKYVPWVRKKWSKEEQIAETIHGRKARLEKMVQQSLKDGGPEEQKAAEQLREILLNSDVHLMKIEAARLLPQLNSETAIEALETASLDANPDVRRIAVQGLGAVGRPQSEAVLAQIVTTDQDTDVRIAATRALSAYQGRHALNSLDQALSDTNPAIQLAAMDSLNQITGESLGADVNAWKSHVATMIQSQPVQTANADQQQSPLDNFR